MLKLLRKYQKSIFAVVAFMVIASFSFFGTYGAMQSESHKEEDVVIGKVLDGSDLSSKDVAQLVRFLDTDFHDIMNGDGRGGANLLNDGVLRNDILKSGLGSLVFDAYKSEIGEELSKKTRKFKEFRPYVHPSKFLSFEGMLSQFAPNYYEDFQNFRMAREEREAFETLAKLYVDQTIFPAEMMRKMMLYVEHQYSTMAAGDPNLRSVDLSLFYAKNVTDWFGPKFLEKVSHFIINGAAYASMQGYKVSLEEAKSSLMQIGARHLKELDPARTITNEDLHKFYKQQVSQLQMLEKDVIRTWQKILVFRKMLDEVGNSIFVDSVLYKEFSEFASKGAKIEIYRLPLALRMKKPEDAMKLESYLEGVSKKRGQTVLTEEFASIDDIKNNVPELVEKRFLVMVAALKKGSLTSEIGVRKTWDWQLNQENWDVLKEAFHELNKCTSFETEERFAYLQGLDESLREKIDQFSRKKILEAEPELVKEKLSMIHPQTRLLAITLAGRDEILPGIVDRVSLLDLLETESEKLSCYSENGEDFYRIEIIDRGSLWEVLTFEEANSRGILESLFKKKEIKENLVAAQEMLVPYMKKIAQEVIAGDEGMVGDVSGSDKGTGPRESLNLKSPLEKQWNLQKEELRITRKMAHPLFDEKLFSMKEGEWSEVVSSIDGPFFFHVLETFVDTSEVARKMEEGRALLGREAKEDLVKELLQKIGKNGS